VQKCRRIKNRTFTAVISLGNKMHLALEVEANSTTLYYRRKQRRGDLGAEPQVAGGKRGFGDAEAIFYSFF